MQRVKNFTVNAFHYGSPPDDKHNLRLRLILLLTGLTCMIDGVFLAIVNMLYNKYYLLLFFVFVTLFGATTLYLSFKKVTRTCLFIIAHILLFILIVASLADKTTGDAFHSEFNYLIVLTVGASLVFRQEKIYLRIVFPLICFVSFLFLMMSGITFSHSELNLPKSFERSLYIFNMSFYSLILLLTTFVYRSDYSSQALLRKDLQAAINDNMLEIYYQPQVNKHREIIGVESLLRWKHRQRGYISPDVFIPIAEKYGMMITLGWWVMENSMKQISNWHHVPKLKDAVVSVNISPLQLLEVSFKNKVCELISRYQIPAGKLKFEITESTLIYDYNKIRDIILELNTYGIKWSIDDFGSGYSSLKLLLDIPVDDVKIDKSLIMSLEKSDSNIILIKTIIDLCKELGITPLAEGVENEVQYSILKDMGCEIFQGFHFSKPLPKKSLEAFLEHNL
ncbi:EAL domain-containing protein [Pantoea sp. B65]|uniref:EAL domain-containing protein n=1 Tax=Pantoea sp. B65 TaxID=2813359 RepID=UPI0039B5AB16